jgi:hypothetical protein
VVTLSRSVGRTSTAYFGGLGAGVLLLGIVLFFLAPAVRRGMEGAE